MHSAEKMAFSPDDVSVLRLHVLCPSVAEADELACKDKNKKNNKIKTKATNEHC